MTQFVLRWLRESGYEPVVAYHQPYSIDRSLSVPAFALPWKRVRRRRLDDNGMEIHELGAWLPELEFMHYYPTRFWRELIDSCRAHVVVSGNCLAALPLARSGRPFLSWIATSWREDRVDREARFSALRRLWDTAVVRPVTRRVECSILRANPCTILALSEYTRSHLDAVAERPVVFGTLPSPVETRLFHPAPGRVVPGRIGFTGRLDDPRKNVSLFLEVIALCLRRGLHVTGVLVGGTLSPPDLDAIRNLEVAGVVEVHPHVERTKLPAMLQTLDVYLVPSKQEGLCIAALEAMACGCPVVSTRCGGPEEFVKEGQTGYLAGFDASELATAVERVIGDRTARDRLASGAATFATARYSEGRARAIFGEAFEWTFERAERCRPS